ncbi:hypothetical protein R5R35_007239 [Gryllus longicercus]|uniref:Apolipoprotein D n=1 Tax=Gryllus longicercus TaxID=2509291 RepID=A0AAN9VDM7_9ORTH
MHSSVFALLQLAASAALLALLLGPARPAHAHPGHMHRCPPPLGKFPFDAQKFSGEWFVVARTPLLKIPDVDSKCHKFTYSTESQGNETRVSMKITIKTDEKAMEPEVKGHFSNRPNAGSVMQGVWRPSAGDKWMPGVFTTSVLVTDYDTYAVTVTCKEMYFDKTDSFDRLLIPHVLSRTPELEANALAVLKNVLTGIDIDEDTIKDQDNSGC